MVRVILKLMLVCKSMFSVPTVGMNIVTVVCTIGITVDRLAYSKQSEHAVHSYAAAPTWPTAL